MKNTQQKLTLSQETVRLLTEEQSGSRAQQAVTTNPLCPVTCSLALQRKGEMQ